MTERHQQQDLIDRTFARFSRNKDNEIFVEQVLDTIEMNVANCNTQALWLNVFNEFESMVKKIKTFHYKP